MAYNYADVTLDNGITVRRNGRVVRDGNEIELAEGEVVTRTGNFFDRAGNAIEKGWDKTKHGLVGSDFMLWGFVGTVCFVFLGIQAWSPLRHARSRWSFPRRIRTDVAQARSNCLKSAECLEREFGQMGERIGCSFSLKMKTID